MNTLGPPIYINFFESNILVARHLWPKMAHLWEATWPTGVEVLFSSLLFINSFIFQHRFFSFFSPYD
jgi:hypothetical protein